MATPVAYPATPPSPRVIPASPAPRRPAARAASPKRATGSGSAGEWVGGFLLIVFLIILIGWLLSQVT
ncbi:MAG: hypothetical protein KDM64_06680 [Verrucomicrobiae bacterium]|nr:hypothetical protein [Verrucomicrobiae bacterium]